MHRHAILAGLTALLLTAPRPALAQAPTFDLSFPVSGDAALDATAESGDIVVRSGEGSSIQVRGRVEVRRGWQVPSNAAELARQVAAQPPVSQHGQTVTLARIADETARRAVSISYEVTVPARTAVTARSGSGNVLVQGVQLAVAARSGSGDVRVQGAGGDADLRSGSGDIDVDGVAGTARVNTGSGSVRARGIGAGLHASTGSGDIDATLTGRGDVQTSTGSGSIRLTGIVGAVQASTGSGDVDVTGTPTGTWKLSTASGRVGVDVPDDAGFTLDARTSSGSLNLDVPLTTQGRMDRRRVQGQVRGGGPALELSTASGSISVR
jgi:DUF4097 and DUF4098 domain-containing protein YvlB